MGHGFDCPKVAVEPPKGDYKHRQECRHDENYANHSPRILGRAAVSEREANCYRNNHYRYHGNKRYKQEDNPWYSLFVWQEGQHLLACFIKPINDVDA